MPAEHTQSGTPVGAFARAVFTVGVCVTLGTGIGLYAMPARTSDYWAWTINAPLSAAFFGSGYLGAATALFLASRASEWCRARTVAVLAFALTSLALLGTLRDLGPFAFDAGGLPEVVAWIWLTVYAVLPPLVLGAFVRQERAGGSAEYEAALSPLAATRIVLGAAGAATGAIGVGLLGDWGSLTARWPWPLPPLAASIVGAWFCTLAAALLWFVLRERDWSRARLGVGAAMIPLALDLVSAARLRDGFHGEVATGLYVCGLALLLVAVATSAVVEERRLRGAFTATAQPAGP